MRLFNCLLAVIVMFVLVACGGGGGGAGDATGAGGGTAAGDAVQMAPVAFLKESAQFRPFEIPMVQLATTTCSSVGNWRIGSDFLDMSTLNDDTITVTIPPDLSPGTYTITYEYFDWCDSQDIYQSTSVTKSVDFEMLASVPIDNPAAYLQQRLDDSILLVDEMLLTATDPGLIDYLSQIKSDAQTGLADVPQLSEAELQATAQFLTYNQPEVVEVPIGGILLTDALTCSGRFAEKDALLNKCRGTVIMASAIGIDVACNYALKSKLGPWTSLAAVTGCAVSSATYIYHLVWIANDILHWHLWSDIGTWVWDKTVTPIIELYDNTLGDALETLDRLDQTNLWDLISGVSVVSTNQLAFAPGLKQTLSTEIVLSVKANDKATLEKIKPFVVSLAAYLPFEIEAFNIVQGADTNDRAGYIVNNMVVHLAITDERLEVADVTTAAASFKLKDGVTLVEGAQVPFQFTYTNYHGESYTHDGLYQHTAPYLATVPLAGASAPVISLSDDRLELVDASYAADGLSIEVKLKDGVVLSEPSFPFTFAYADFLGRDLTFSSAWYNDYPLPLLPNLSLWLDLRPSMPHLWLGAPGDYSYPLGTGVVIPGMEYVENIEVVDQSLYMALGDLYTPPFTVDLSNGVKQSQVKLNNWSMTPYYDAIVPTIGDITDSFTYRASNPYGTTAVTQGDITIRYDREAARRSLSLQDKLPTYIGGWERILLTGTTGYLDPGYDAYLDVENLSDYEYRVEIILFENGVRKHADNLYEEVRLSFYDSSGQIIPLTHLNPLLDYTMEHIVNCPTDTSCNYEVWAAKLTDPAIRSIASYKLEQKCYANIQHPTIAGWCSPY